MHINKAKLYNNSYQSNKGVYRSKLGYKRYKMQSAARKGSLNLNYQTA